MWHLRSPRCILRLTNSAFGTEGAAEEPHMPPPIRLIMALRNHATVQSCHSPREPTSSNTTEESCVLSGKTRNEVSEAFHQPTDMIDRNGMPCSSPGEATGRIRADRAIYISGADIRLSRLPPLVVKSLPVSPLSG